MSVQNHFTRPTILAASVLLERLTQAKFDQMVQRLGLDQAVAQGDAISIPKKVVQLSQQVTLNPNQLVQTHEGLLTLAEAFVREALVVLHRYEDERVQDNFLRSLDRDGFTVSWEAGECAKGTPPWLRRSLPTAIDLPEGDNELHSLLKANGFTLALGHLDQAVDSHTRGDWASANGQFRTFMEQLINDITARGFAEFDAPHLTLNNRLQLLGSKGFFSVVRGEWTGDSKGFINGLFNMLNSEGSHPGLSDTEHCTFKLHLTLVTARVLLRRLQAGQTQ
ncbi:hypothetical protein [Pseudomonas brassicacearum]|uniref:hypothetical protein n=1 Tax=Pseudomonas brassicacearum TaxID=930166 RepID=UPI000761E017|nr:hypothetical protein [Pseudomonas brassicacearum]AOS40469.1 hypothetical protein A0U95_17310 [Pseudomonas brassicacearum]